MTIAWLCADDNLFSDRIDFTDLSNALTIPVVSLNVAGGGRTTLYPGFYFAPRVRVYNDVIATASKLVDGREISFSCRFDAQGPGQSFDDILRKWYRIEQMLNRAVLGSGNYARGTGVVLAVQLMDSTQFTFFDVRSGILTPSDTNLPGFNVWAGTVQLTCAPFGRGDPMWSSEVNALNGDLASSYYVPNVVGDAESLCELRLTDVSTSGRIITGFRVARRSYPTMSESDFVPVYDTSGSTIASQTWQQVASQLLASGDHMNGLFTVCVAVNDASPVIGEPQNLLATVRSLAGSLQTGTYRFLLAPKDALGRLGPLSPAITASVQNVVQSGALQTAVTILRWYDAEDQQWLLWKQPPVVSGAVGTTALIDNTSPIAGSYSFHFKAVAPTTPGALSSAGDSLVLPAVANLASKSGIKSVALLLRAASWAPDPANVDNYPRLAFGAQIINPDNITQTQFNGVEFRRASGTNRFNIVASTGLGATGIPPWSQQILTTVTLVPGETYLIEFNYDTSESETQLRVYITDQTSGAAPNTILVAGFVPTAEPFELSINAYATGQAGSPVEEFRVDNIIIADGYIGNASGGIGGGSAVVLDWSNGLNTSDLDLLANLSGRNEWYQLDIGLHTSYTVTQFPPPGAALVAGPPTALPAVDYAQVRLKVYPGSSMSTPFVSRVVATKVANGLDEIVKFTGIPAPPGVKAEFRPWDNCTIAVEAISGSVVNSAFSVKRLWLLPDDEPGWISVRAQQLGLSQKCVWRIGTNRWGQTYAILEDPIDGHVVGYATVSGRLSAGPGDNTFVIVAETDDGLGNVICDLSHLQWQVSAQLIPLFHFLAVTPG